jgi:hypothetical protein
MRKVFLGIVFLLTLFTNDLYAYCSHPSVPYNKPTKPNVPFCVNEFAGTHTCDSWTINSYNSAVRNYKYEVDAYIEELNRYVRAASNYAQCEASNL